MDLANVVTRDDSDIRGLCNTKHKGRKQAQGKVYLRKNAEIASSDARISKKRKRRLPVGELVLQPLLPLGLGQLDTQVRLIYTHRGHHEA